MKSVNKKLIIAIAIAVMAMPAFALGMQFGGSPQTNTLLVSVRIPQRVGINLTGTDIEFFLDDASVNYPPASLPGYYFPTNAASAHVPMSVFCNVPTGWELTVIASGDFDASLPVSQLYYADAGEAQTADGTAAPGGGWNAFSSTVAGTVATDAAKTTGWDDLDQDYELMITGDESVIDPEASVTITYTITAL